MAQLPPSTPRRPAPNPKGQGKVGNRPAEACERWPCPLPLEPDSVAAKLLYRLWTRSLEANERHGVPDADQHWLPYDPHPRDYWATDWGSVETLHLPGSGRELPVEIDIVISQLLWRAPLVSLTIAQFHRTLEEDPVPEWIRYQTGEAGCELMVLHSRSAAGNGRTWYLDLSGADEPSEMPLDVALAGGVTGFDA